MAENLHVNVGNYYLAEWDFKWNTRNITDGERAALALAGAEGRRLTYREPHKTQIH